MTELYLVGSVLVILAAIPANIIVVVYLRLPWRASLIGRSFMRKAIGIALILDLSLLALILGRDNVWWELARVVVFGYFVWALWLQMLVLFRTIREGQLDGNVSASHEYGDA